MILYLSIRAFLVALWCQIWGHKFRRFKTLHNICSRCGTHQRGQWVRHQGMKESGRRLRQILHNQIDDAQLIEGTRTWHQVYQMAQRMMRESTEAEQQAFAEEERAKGTREALTRFL